MHTLDIAKFREMFEAFSDADIYTDSAINLAWMKTTFIAETTDNWLLSGERLQNLLYFITAHFLYMSSASATGGAGGEGSSGGGIVTSATEGSVSVSFATPNVSDFTKYMLSQSEYGLEVLSLLKSLVVGGVLIGGAPETAAIRDTGGVFFAG